LRLTEISWRFLLLVRMVCNMFTTSSFFSTVTFPIVLVGAGI
jgi:hypothetical protein